MNGRISKLIRDYASIVREDASQIKRAWTGMPVDQRMRTRKIMAATVRVRRGRIAEALGEVQCGKEV